ncbi:MAG: hypothetical protein ACYC1Z_02450 [Georgenia sp.]
MTQPPTPADLRPRRNEQDPLEQLDELDGTPLAEQVAVFEAIHSHLSARLTGAES